MRTHEVIPLERFREAVLMALPDEHARSDLKPLPERGDFDVQRVIRSEYFFC